MKDKEGATLELVDGSFFGQTWRFPRIVHVGPFIYVIRLTCKKANIGVIDNVVRGW